MNGTVTYELGDGRWVTLDAHAVQLYGAADLLREMGVEMPTARVPVIQHGRRVGTVPGDFEPLNAKSRTFLYDVRPGDFKREGDHWVADKMLGPGDLDSLLGFERDGH
ncbi:MAG: hypothetical protein WBH00_23215 [Xanthobacteraceae bacterium]